jgi:tRNA (cmo5U34)-methyltransferase
MELQSVFERIPNARVTCVDVSRGMLDILSQNYASRMNQIELVQASYVDWQAPKGSYTCALSVYTMHHFLEAQKVGIYRGIHAALKPGGCYVEADYMVGDIMMEQYRRRHRHMMRALDGATGDYHIDLPFTPRLQQQLLRSAGFGRVTVPLEHIYATWCEAILRADK